MKVEMGRSKMGFIEIMVIFHFHDYGRKGKNTDHEETIRKE